jgi:cysteine desulfurase/selenocysteine lyase
MSTNINPDIVTNIGELEKLANQFFKSLPGDAGKEVLLQPQATQPSLENSEGLVQSVPANTSYTLPSFGGIGVSPSAAKSYSNFPSSDIQGNVPVNHFATGQVPKSVAGSGISPSAFDNNSSFNIADPQTSLPDPHFEDGKVPKSVAGSGRQPSLQKKETVDELPYSTDYSFQEDLHKALSAFNTFIPVSQLPISGFGGASYYFLQDKNSLQFDTALPKVLNHGEKNNSAINGLQSPPFDVNLIKKDFPILNERVNGRQLVWLDNAATTQKPKQVIDRISYFYEHENSNVHRAAHELAARATDAYEGAREKVRRFLNAKSKNEIVFVRGATEAINLVAKSWGEENLNAGDEIIISHLEHHANIVPWQQLAAKKGLKIKVIPVDDDGQLLLDEYAKLLSTKTKLVSFTQVSNALGTITPAAEVAAMAHAAGAKVLIDGAQSVSHMRVDVQSLDADWFVFSGHKVFAPTGIGVVYGKEELLNATQPWQGGGNMIVDVTFEYTKYHNAPGRFEAGTGNIADAVGLGAAIDYVSKIGIELIGQYEHYLLVYGTSRLREISGLKLIGTAAEKASVLSFILDGFTNDEVGQALNKEGIAVRTGHHCAQPILRRFGVESTVRPSLAFYNSCADIDALIIALVRLKRSRKV